MAAGPPVPPWPPPPSPGLSEQANGGANYSKDERFSLLRFNSTGEAYEVEDDKEHKLVMWVGGTPNFKAKIALQDKEW